MTRGNTARTELPQVGCMHVLHFGASSTRRGAYSPQKPRLQQDDVRLHRHHHHHEGRGLTPISDAVREHSHQPHNPARPLPAISSTPFTPFWTITKVGHFCIKKAAASSSTVSATPCWAQRTSQRQQFSLSWRTSLVQRELSRHVPFDRKQTQTD